MTSAKLTTHWTRPAALTTLAACLAVGVGAAAYAGTNCATPAGTAPEASSASVTVAYRAGDLATDQGAAALYARISAAAHKVCAVENIRDLQAVAASQACQREAIARAVSDVHSAHLAALHTQHAQHG